MNRTLLFCIFFVTQVPLSGQISSFPYYQDFESFSLCTPSCQGPCPLSDNWTNPSGTGDIGNWMLISGPTSTPLTGPSRDADPGTAIGKYLYVEALNSCIGVKEVFLETPEFDFQNNSLPVLEFFYHMYGHGQGTLHLDADTNGVTVMDIIPPIQGNEDRWKRMSVCLENFSGLASVTFRFRAVTSFSETGDMALDAVKVYQGHPNDVYVKEILTTGCGLSQDHEISFSFGNLGRNTVSNVTATYSIDNGNFIPIEFIPGNHVSCATSTYTFIQKANLLGPGAHKITVVVKLFNHNDPDSRNDTLVSFVSNIPVIDQFPYEEGFEQGPGAWQAAGERISWARGVPTGTWISSAGEGMNAWVTNLSGPYQKLEFSFLESDCFDFTSMTADPILTFLHTFALESPVDLFWVEYSTSGGNSWHKLGTNTSGIANWYNSFSKQAWTSLSQAGSGNWQEASHELTGLAGKMVRFRFVMVADGSVQEEGVGIDNVRILNPRDLAVIKILSPVNNCEGLLSANETITARVLNKGYYNVSGYSMGLKVDNQTFPTEPVSGVLNAGDSMDYSFVSTGDFSAIGKHFITVAAAYSSDSDPSDNQLVRQAGNFLPPLFDLGADTVLCGGDTLTLDPGIANADYLWSNGFTTQELTVTTTGFYTIELIDDNGCMGQDSIQVVIPPPLGIRIDSLETIKCYGDSTGKIEIRVLGGVPPYSLLWATGDTIRILKDLPGGYYPYMITDGLGCVKIDSVEVPQNDSIYVEIDALVDAGCPEDSTGAILITPKGGQGPYGYLWSNFSKTEDLPRIPEGVYWVSIEDVNGCTYQSPFYEIVTNDTLPKADFNFLISGGEVAFKDLSVNTVGYTWNFGDGSMAVFDSDPLYTYAANDTYTVMLIATNSCGVDTLTRNLVMNSVGIDGETFPASISLFPNPVSGGTFYLEVEEANLRDASFSLYQVNGKQVLYRELGSIHGSRRIQVDVGPDWAAGLYLLTIRSREGQVHRKIVIR